MHENVKTSKVTNETMRLITHSWQVNNRPAALHGGQGVGGVYAAVQQNKLLCDHMAVTIATTVMWWLLAVQVDDASASGELYESGVYGCIFFGDRDVGFICSAS